MAKILLTNDDGYKSILSEILFDVLVNEGHEVYFVAPNVQQSGTGNTISFITPIRAWKGSLFKREIFIVEGTPSDCVIYALNELDVKFDLVVSGINSCDNTSYHNIFKSGTCGAAMEAGFYGIPSVAFSTVIADMKLVQSNEKSLYGLSLQKIKIMVDKSVKIINKILQKSKSSLGKILFTNVTFPEDLTEKTPKRLTVPALRKYTDSLEHRKDPRGLDIYWIWGVRNINQAEASDVYCVFIDQMISISEIKLEKV